MTTRTAGVCLLFVLLTGALVAPADAAKKEAKKVTRDAISTYTYPAVGAPSARAACLPCPAFQVLESERWVSMEVRDEVSLAPVAFSIFQNVDGDTALEGVGGPYCGSSGKQPVEITPGEDVGFIVYAFGDVVCPGAIGTSGTVTAVFSNVP